MENKIAFIGTGYMGTALLRALCRKVPADQIVLTDQDKNKAAALAAELGCVYAEDNLSAAGRVKYILLCVKPQVLGSVLEELRPALAGRTSRDCVVVSIAAGIEIHDIRAKLRREDLPVIRLMPNTPALVGKGLTFFATDGVATAEQVEELREMLSFSGATETIDERFMDHASTMASCTPAFFYQCIEALADGGVMIGLTRKQAQSFAAHAMLGAASMVLEQNEHPGALKDMVCSPGGTAIAGIAKLEESGLRNALIQAVRASYARNKELAQLGK